MTKLLIVSDDVTLLENLKLFLNRGNFSVLSVEYTCSVLEGLTAYHLFLPDFVLIDFTLPITDKLNFLKQLRFRKTDLKAVIAGQKLWMDFIQGATFFYADAYLEKPVTEAAFISCLNKLIS